jgi:hypothetical protein
MYTLVTHPRPLHSFPTPPRPSPPLRPHRRAPTAASGNFCKGGRRGRIAGNGRLIVAEFWKNSSGCGWDVVKEVHIPSSANFMDYSGMDMLGNKVRTIWGR